jgi:hypothetical protein
LIPLHALPRPADLKIGELLWSGYGFPEVHPTGLGLHGAITMINGNVEDVPAIQLQCEEGGLGRLEGISGSPVCVAGSIVGVIRFGPPGLYQKVQHATSIVDVAKEFPEVAERLAKDSAGGGGAPGGSQGGASSVFVYTRVQIYVVLTALTPTLYANLVFFLNPPEALLAPERQPLAEQAMSLIKYYETQPQGLLPIVGYLEEHFPHLLQKVRQSA